MLNNLAIGEKIIAEDLLIRRKGIRRFDIIKRVETRGYFFLGDRKYKNVINRNMGYLLDALMRNTTVSLTDATGATDTGLSITGRGLTHFIITLGSGTTSPTITDNGLASSKIQSIPINYLDVDESQTSQTGIVWASAYSAPASATISEVSLALALGLGDTAAYLLARSLLSTPISLNGGEERFDGYFIVMSAEFTRWFARAIASAFSCSAYGNLPQRKALNADGTYGVFSTCSNPFTGTLDLRIGSDPAAPTPTDTDLKSTIGSLNSQNQTVEVDAGNQETRIVRTGTITPTSNLTLNEIGLFATVNEFSGSWTSTTTKSVLLLRAVYPNPITLSSGVTYTMGVAIVLK